MKFDVNAWTVDLMFPAEFGPDKEPAHAAGFAAARRCLQLIDFTCCPSPGLGPPITALRCHVLPVLRMTPFLYTMGPMGQNQAQCCLEEVRQLDVRQLQFLLSLSECNTGGGLLSMIASLMMCI